MVDWPEKEHYEAEDLVEIIRILRDEKDGCPWDKVQTHQSIRKNFLEETCEALEAIDADDAGMLREELGDVLMQVAFHAVLEEEQGRSTFSDICREVCEKLVYRHPHVFASSAARGAGEDYYKLNFIFEIKAGTYPFAKTFFVAVLCVLGSFAVILPCGFNKWLSVPAFLLVGFWGYRLGLNLVGCLQPSATSGAVCIVLYYLPVYLTAAGALIAFICIVFSNSCGTGMSSARFKKLIFKALPLLAVFAAMALICGVIIPLLYRLIFL